MAWSGLHCRVGAAAAPKAMRGFHTDASPGPEQLYQFFIKPRYFLFMMLVGSLKTVLPVGDTSKAFSQFLSGC